MLDGEQKHKEQEAKFAAERLAMQAKSTGAIGGYAVDEAKRASLRERVAMDLRRSQREAAKRDRLAELDMLLDKHPEIARILDLLEEVRG